MAVDPQRGRDHDLRPAGAHEHGDLRQIIAAGGALPPSSLDSWPTQASYASKGDWSGLASYNRRHH